MRPIVVVAAAMMSFTAAAGSFAAALPADAGTRIVLDQVNDQGLWYTPLDTRHWDVREVWADSDGQNVNFTWFVTRLDPPTQQPYTKYSLVFRTPSALPEEVHHLYCWYGWTTDGSHHRCEAEVITRVESCFPGPETVQCLTVRRLAPPLESDMASGILRTQLPYSFLEAQTGDALWDASGSASLCESHGGGWACPIDMDRYAQDTPYALE